MYEINVLLLKQIEMRKHQKMPGDCYSKDDCYSIRCPNLILFRLF